MRARLKGTHDAAVGRGKFTRHRRTLFYAVDRYEYRAKVKRGDAMVRMLKRILAHAKDSMHNIGLLSVEFRGIGSREVKGPLNEPFRFATKSKPFGIGSKEAISLIRAVGDNDLFFLVGKRAIELPGSKLLRMKLQALIVRVYSAEGHGYQYPRKPWRGADEEIEAVSKSRKFGVHDSTKNVVFAYLEKHPQAVPSELYRLNPGASKSYMRTLASSWRRSIGEPVARTGKARKSVTIAEQIRAILKKSPKATNAELAKKFPGVSKAVIRSYRSRG